MRLFGKTKKMIEELETLVKFRDECQRTRDLKYRVRIGKLEKDVKHLILENSSLHKTIEIINHKRFKNGDIVKHTCYKFPFEVVCVITDYGDKLEYCITNREKDITVYSCFTSLELVERKKKKSKKKKQ